MLAYMTPLQQLPSISNFGPDLSPICLGLACPSCLSLLPPMQVARLARKLPQGDLAVMAAQLGSSGTAAALGVTENGEEDLT